MEELVNLLRMNQKELKEFLYNQLNNKNMNPLSEDGFLYAEGKIPVLLVAHMDTVDSRPPENIICKKNIIYNSNGIIGGDDRCGIYAILKLLENNSFYVLFTEDEEIGCVGAKKAIERLDIPDVKYIIEFDRKGEYDCVFYDCGNKEFMDYIEDFGFLTDFGSYSDIAVLGKAWNIASVNISSGYYNEHTSDEYIVFSILEKNIRKVNRMLKKIDKAPFFDYKEINWDNLLNLDLKIKEGYLERREMLEESNSLGGKK